MDRKHRSGFLSRRVVYLSVDKIRPNPAQPRRYFDEASLDELSRSILRYGILQPLTVRRGAQGYELIAGERRLRAARLAGLREVPCLLARADEEDSPLLALIENLQRRDLHWYEEAGAIAQLISAYGLSQEQAAEKLGKSQSAVANKLRLLRLPKDVLERLRAGQLGERHARALLRLPDAETQRMALCTIVDNGLSVAAAEAYVEDLLRSPVREADAKKPAPRRSLILKDVRVFLNSLNHSLALMKQGGIDAGVKREETEDALILTISIPKEKAAAPN